MLRPQRFGPYILLDRLSTGGMAEVFLAKSSGPQGSETIVAIKRILPSVSEDSDFTTMFIDEARISANLTHASIGQVIEFGQVNQQYYIAMEYIAGRDLRAIQTHLQNTGGRLDVDVVLHVGARLCQALDYAHRQKGPTGSSMEIVHRDVSPPNVIISFDGEVKLIDFGIAKAASRATRTRAGKLKGKFSYMSPEQVQGLPVDRRSDIFSLGVVLYELLTGSRLFHGENQLATLNLVRRAEVAPPSTVCSGVPLEVDRIVLKALARDRDERYGWATELRAAIERFLARTGSSFDSPELAAWMSSHFPGELEAERLMRERVLALRPDDVPDTPEKTDRGDAEVAEPAEDPAGAGEDEAGLSRPPTRALSERHRRPTPEPSDRPPEEITAAGISSEATDALVSSGELQVAPADPLTLRESQPGLARSPSAQLGERASAEVHEALTVAALLDPATQDRLRADPEEPASIGLSEQLDQPTAPSDHTDELEADEPAVDELGALEATVDELEADEPAVDELGALEPEPEHPVRLTGPRVFGPRADKADAAMAHLATALQQEDQPSDGAEAVRKPAAHDRQPSPRFDHGESPWGGRAIAPGSDRDAAAVGGALVVDSRVGRRSPEVLDEAPVDLTALGVIPVEHRGLRDPTSVSGTRQVEPPGWSGIKVALFAGVATLVVAAMLFAILGVSRGRDAAVESGSVLVTASDRRASCSVSLGLAPKGLLQSGRSLTLNGIPPGRHLVSLDCLGFLPFATTVEVRASQTTIVLAPLRSK